MRIASRANIYRSLAVCIEAGLPLERSLRTVAGGAAGRLARALLAVADDLAAGKGFSESLAIHPKVFTPLDVSLVSAGETSGRLDESMATMAQWYGFRDSLRRVVISGMIQPVLIFHAASFIGPLPAYFMGGIDGRQYTLQVASYLAMLYVAAGIILAIARFTPPSGPIRKLLDRIMLSIPVVGRAVRNLALCRYCRAFHMLYKAGIPGSRCAEMAVEAGRNSAVMRLVEGGAESARGGRAISEGFSSGLSSEFLDLWRIGEETGTLDNATKRLADAAAQSAQGIILGLGKWIPRIFYLGICLWMAMMIFRNYGQIMTKL